MLWDVGSEFIYGLVYILIWAEMLIDRLKNGLLFNGPHVQWVLLFLMSTNLLGPYANGPKLTHLLEVTSSSTSASMWQARHNHFPRHCHVIWYANVHIMLHIIYVWCGHWICDDVCGVYFRHKKWAWVGLREPEDILWRFQNVMDQTIHDCFLRNATRCNLWHSIHDESWDCCRYYFMTVF